MKQYEMFELQFNGQKPAGLEALTDVTAEFSNGEESWNVKGFYDGDGTYKVRFLPQKAGTYNNLRGKEEGHRTKVKVRCPSIVIIVKYELKKFLSIVG